MIKLKGRNWYEGRGLGLAYRIVDVFSHEVRSVQS